MNTAVPEFGVATFTKIGADNQPLPDDASEFAAVRVALGGGAFDVLARNINKRAASQEKCVKACAALDELGSRDWRLISRREFEAILSHAHRNPAADPRFFPWIKSEWYWTSTDVAGVPAIAWGVFACAGLVGYDRTWRTPVCTKRRYNNGFALAVRRAGQ